MLMFDAVVVDVVIIAGLVHEKIFQMNFIYHIVKVLKIMLAL